MRHEPLAPLSCAYVSAWGLRLTLPLPWVPSVMSGPPIPSRVSSLAGAGAEAAPERASPHPPEGSLELLHATGPHEYVGPAAFTRLAPPHARAQDDAASSSSRGTWHLWTRRWCKVCYLARFNAKRLIQNCPRACRCRLANSDHVMHAEATRPASGVPTATRARSACRLPCPAAQGRSTKWPRPRLTAPSGLPA